MNRRALMASAALTLAASGSARAAAQGTGRVVTAVLESEAVILDPHMTTAAISRTCG